MVGDAKRFKRKMLYWMCAGRREKRRLGNVRHRGGTVRRRRADGLGDIFVRQAWNVSLEGAGDADWALSCPLAFVRGGLVSLTFATVKACWGRGVGEGLSRTPFLASLRKGRAPSASGGPQAVLVRGRSLYRAICPDEGVFITCCKMDSYFYNVRRFGSNYSYPSSVFWGRWGSLSVKKPFLPQTKGVLSPQKSVMSPEPRRRRSLTGIDSRARPEGGPRGRAC